MQSRIILPKWIVIALTNLAIVAMLGLVMRLKIIFSIPFIDFKYILHAHSHFAFGGWITIALFALLAYQVLPPVHYEKRIYNSLLAGILISSAGMLLSFPFQGYGAVSIFFSTTFIFTAYIFAFVFIRDIIKSNVNRTVRMLSISALVYLTLSSAGPFTLAYLMANKSNDIIIYKDAVYTYLHFQYNGFFTLSVFALIFNYFKIDTQKSRLFALLLNLAVIPSLFMSYLWHDPVILIRVIAIAGCILLVSVLVLFILMQEEVKEINSRITFPVRVLFMLSMIAFGLKLLFQSLTIIPALEILVFSNRPVIIGFLHLVLLGFITLFLFFHIINTGILILAPGAKIGVILFTTGVILNELVLMIQGLGVMLMITASIANWLLLMAAVLLFTGALFLMTSAIKQHAIMSGSISVSETVQIKNYKK